MAENDRIARREPVGAAQLRQRFRGPAELEQTEPVGIGDRPIVGAQLDGPRQQVLRFAQIGGLSPLRQSISNVIQCTGVLRLHRQHLAHGGERFLPHPRAILRAPERIQDGACLRMRAHGGGEDLLRLGRLSRAIEGLEQRQRHAFLGRMLGKENAQAPHRFGRLSRPPPGERALYLRVEHQRVRLDAEERRRGRFLSARSQRPLHRLECERTLAASPDAECPVVVRLKKSEA